MWKNRFFKMPFWDNENPPYYIPDQIPPALDRGQIRQDEIFKCQQALRELGISRSDMDTLAKQPDLALRVMAYLEMHEGTSPTEAMLAVVLEADLLVTGDSHFDGRGSISSQFHLQLEGTSFGDASMLKRKMMDEA